MAQVAVKTPSISITGKCAATNTFAAGKKASPFRYRENPTSIPAKMASYFLASPKLSAFCFEPQNIECRSNEKLY